MAKSKPQTPPGVKIVVQNRRARHDYFIEETIEAGIVLKGSEVKSLRAGHVQLSDSYASIINGEAWLENCHISEFPNAGPYYNHEPLRRRKLLLNRREIERLYVKSEQRGKTLIPLKLYFRDGKAKVELAVATGKKKYDKRESIRERDDKRIKRGQTDDI